VTHIRVSMANCCDCWTEDKSEEGTDVKPFAGDEFPCTVCVDCSAILTACWHWLHITSRPGRGLVDGLVSALAKALVDTVKADASEVVNSREWVLASAGSDTEYTTAARGSVDCSGTRTIFEHSSELFVWSANSRLNWTLRWSSAGS